MNQQVNVVGFPVEFVKRRFEVVADRRERGAQSVKRIPVKDLAPISRHKDQMSVNPINNVPTSPKFVLHGIRPMGMMPEW